MFVRESRFRGRPGSVFLYLLKARLPVPICSMSRKPLWMNALACSRHLAAEDSSPKQCCVAFLLMRFQASGLALMGLDIWI